MDLTGYARMMARYNRIANELVMEKCALLDDGEYRRARRVSFGSVHALLNHMLLGDRIWMSRFEGGGSGTPALNTVLFEDFAGLRAARVAEDARIEGFFAGVEVGFWDRPLRYVNSRWIDYVDAAPMAVVHFFNHQTHHRGQVHVLLAESGVGGPSLDLHRIANP